MSNEHFQIHRGNAWEFSLVNTGVILNGETLIQITLGADVEMHLKELLVWGNAATAQLEIIKAPTFTTGTTAITPQNLNDEDGGAPTGITMFSDPTGISGGTLWKDRLFGGGAGVGNTASAAENQTDRERILKANTTYIIRVTNLENNARDFSIDGYFYLATE
jgi:hypothetical protein